MIYQDTMNQRRLIRFMDRLVRASRQKVFLLLDNLKVHHGKLAAKRLEKHKDKMEVSFLTPYAPEYNPDEYLNHALKIFVHSGLPPHTIEEISHKMQSFMRKLQHHPYHMSSFFRTWNPMLWQMRFKKHNQTGSCPKWSTAGLKIGETPEKHVRSLPPRSTLLALKNGSLRNLQSHF